MAKKRIWTFLQDLDSMIDDCHACDCTDADGRCTDLTENAELQTGKDCIADEGFYVLEIVEEVEE